MKKGDKTRYRAKPRAKVQGHARVAVEAYLNGLNTHVGRVTMRASLRTIAKFFDEGSTEDDFPWYTLKHDGVQRLRAHLVEKYQPRSVNRHLAALRRVLRSCWKLKLMSADDYSVAVDVRSSKLTGAPTGRRLQHEELRRLVNELSADGNLRDAAIVSLLYAAGFRRFEVAKLDVGDYDRAAGTVRVIGKGGKYRQVTLHEGWRAPVEAWLDARGASDKSTPMFPGDRGARNKRIDANGVSYVVRRACERAGLAHFTPHDLRRSFITDLLEAGVDLSTVRRVAGHESVDTTALYDRRGGKTEVEAVAKLKGPRDP